MEQYMAEATPGSSKSPVELKGYFSAWLDLLDSENRIQITLIINFPINAAKEIKALGDIALGGIFYKFLSQQDSLF